MGKKNVANEQAIAWLKSMAADENVFNSINAENCLELIHKQKKALVSLGAHFHNLRQQRDRYEMILEAAWDEMDRER
jgi:hypothetical protein